MLSHKGTSASLPGMLEASDVGRAMERLRGDRTQREVAKRAGVNRSSWSSYEAGRRMPGADTWTRIVRGLDCSQEDFDRAVLRAWRERLDHVQREGGSEEGVEVVPGPESVVLTASEVLDLASSSERLHSLSRSLLRRRGDAS